MFAMACIDKQNEMKEKRGTLSFGLWNCTIL